MIAIGSPRECRNEGKRVAHEPMRFVPQRILRALEEKIEVRSLLEHQWPQKPFHPCPQTPTALQRHLNGLHPTTHPRVAHPEIAPDRLQVTPGKTPRRIHCHLARFTGPTRRAPDLSLTLPIPLCYLSPELPPRLVAPVVAAPPVSPPASPSPLAPALAAKSPHPPNKFAPVPAPTARPCRFAPLPQTAHSRGAPARAVRANCPSTHSTVSHGGAASTPAVAR